MKLTLTDKASFIGFSIVFIMGAFSTDELAIFFGLAGLFVMTLFVRVMGELAVITEALKSIKVINNG